MRVGLGLPFVTLAQKQAAAAAAKKPAPAPKVTIWQRATQPIRDTYTRVTSPGSGYTVCPKIYEDENPNWKVMCKGPCGSASSDCYVAMHDTKTATREASDNVANRVEYGKQISEQNEQQAMYNAQANIDANMLSQQQAQMVDPYSQAPAEEYRAPVDPAWDPRAGSYLSLGMGAIEQEPRTYAMLALLVAAIVWLWSTSRR